MDSLNVVITHNRRTTTGTQNSLKIKGTVKCNVLIGLKSQGVKLGRHI